MSEIELRNVGKSYGNVAVLNDISLEIKNGEFVVLVGPSGCGKSTLLRMIAGLEDISAGEITIGGKIINDMPAKERDLAMVFQSYALYPHMKVADNMSFALKLAGVSKDEIRRRVKEAANILGLEHLLERLPRELSGGQRQRVAMGRAIVRDARAFLFDEPLSNLDAKLRVKMRGEIKKLHQRLGKTTIYVTHDQTEAMTMADKIVVLNGGKIEQVGPPLELYRNPCNLFVAGFIGSPEMNAIKGVIEDESLKLADGTLLPLPENVRLEQGKNVIYGVRPQHISLCNDGISVDVTLIEPTGDSQEVSLRLAGFDVTMVLGEEPVLAEDSKIQVKMDLNHVLLFDEGSGERIK